jgi:hypothetical protein
VPSLPRNRRLTPTLSLVALGLWWGLGALACTPGPSNPDGGGMSISGTSAGSGSLASNSSTGSGASSTAASTSGGPSTTTTAAGSTSSASGGSASGTSSSGASSSSRGACAQVRESCAPGSAPCCPGLSCYSPPFEGVPPLCLANNATSCSNPLECQSQNCDQGICACGADGGYSYDCSFCCNRQTCTHSQGGPGYFCN